MAAHCNTCWQLCDTTANLYPWHRKGHRNPLFCLVFYNSQKYTCGGLSFPHSWSQFFHVFEPKQYLQALRLIFQLSALEATIAMLWLYCVIFSLWCWLQRPYNGLQTQLGGQDMLIICDCTFCFCSLCLSWNKRPKKADKTVEPQ